MLQYNRHIIGFSLGIFGYLRKSLAIFGNIRNCWKTMVWPSDNFWRILGTCSETFGKSSKKSSLVCVYNKQINTWLLVDMWFLFSCLTWYLTPSLRSLVRYQVEPVVCAWGAAPFSQSGLWCVLVHLTHFEFIVNSLNIFYSKSINAATSVANSYPT